MTRAATILILTMLCAAAAGQSPADGAEAPVNCWTTEGGSPSGSRRTATRPIRDVGAQAWSRGFERIEGEPLVWEDAVVVVEVQAPGKRRIHVLNLADGAERGHSRVIKTDLPLEPSIWGKLIVARVDAKKIQSWRIGYTHLYRKWSVEAPEPISKPVLIGREVYVRSGTTLVRYDYGSKEPVWRSTAARFHGTPAVYGDHVYSIACRDGVPSLAGVFVVNRETGDEQDSTGLEFHGEMPAVDEGRVRVGPRYVIAHFGRVIRDGISDVRIRCTPGPPALGEITVGPRSPCALDGDRVLGYFHDPDAEYTSLVLLDEKRTHVLASPEAHAELATGLSAPVVMSGVAYVAPAAVELGRQFHKILWRLDASYSRLVPARETLLAVEDGKGLAAFRSSGVSRDEWRRDVPDGTPARVVLADGRIRESEVKLDGDEIAIHKRKEKWERYPLDAVLLIEDPDGRILLWPSTARAVRSFDVIRDSERAESYLELCRKSARSKDPDIMARYIDVAVRNGVEEDELASTRKAEARERRKRSPSKVNQRVVREIETIEQEIARRPIELLESRHATLPDDAPDHVRFAVLRRLIEADPTNERAAAAVRDMIPEGVRPAKLEPGRWIDFVQAIRETPIEVVLPPSLDQKKTTWEEGELGATRPFWREDLVGVRSERLFIMTPRKNVARVATCLSLGELVCDALEDIFAAGDVSRDERFPLKIFLYESQKEYIAESHKRGMGDVGYTLGHFSPRENVSRMFVPDDSDVLNDMLTTFVHELTHHWTAERCPLFKSRASTLENSTLRGFWIVEGFAVMVQEFVFDAQHRKWRADDPRADSADTIANSIRKQRIPWKTLFGMNQIALHSFIDKTPSDDLQVPMTWTLGISRRMSWLNVFYAQSAATCHLLFSDETLRPKLLEYVKKYFTGKTKGLTMEQAFGLSADELGKRVVEYSRRRAAAN